MNLEEYRKDLNDIDEDILNYVLDEEDNDEKFNQVTKRVTDVKKKYHVIFVHSMNKANWDFNSEIIILDQPKDNLYIFKESKDNYEVYTLNDEDLNNLKDKLNNKALYDEERIMISPALLDGTSHKIDLINQDNATQIDASNLRYFSDDTLKGKEEYFDKEDIEYTKLIIDILTTVQELLNKNNISFDMFDEFTD